MPGVSGVRLRKFLERRLSGVSRKKKNSYSAEKNRSEEHTSELQSQSNLVCRLLLEKKKNKPQTTSSLFPPCTSLHLRPTQHQLNLRLRRSRRVEHNYTVESQSTFYSLHLILRTSNI